MLSVDLLPPRQRAVFEFIRDETGRTGVCPSFRDIADHFGVASKNTVFGHVKALKEKGFLALERSQGRAIQVLVHEPQTMPLVGQVGAGPLAEVFEVVQALNVTAILDDANVAVRVADDSMRKERMAAGDVLIGTRRRGSQFQPKWLVRAVN